MPGIGYAGRRSSPIPGERLVGNLGHARTQRTDARVCSVLAGDVPFEELPPGVGGPASGNASARSQNLLDIEGIEAFKRARCECRTFLNRQGSQRAIGEGI